MKKLNHHGEVFPRLGLGTWQIKGETCRKAVKSALNIGYRHIDTAQAYGNENYVGSGIKNSKVDREDIWLTTKLWRDNLDKDKLKKSFENSLTKLNTNYVDLLLIHWPFQEMDLKAVLDEMADLVDEGKVKNIGVSNFTSNQLERASELSEKPIFTNQVEYHPFLSQDEVLEKAREIGTTVTAYSPLARGDVLGQQELKEIGEKHEKSEAQIVIRWLLQQDNVAAIPKAASLKHRKQNFNVFDFQLNEKEMERIHRLKRNDRKVDPSFAPEWD